MKYYTEELFLFRTTIFDIADETTARPRHSCYLSCPELPCKLCLVLNSECCKIPSIFSNSAISIKTEF